MKTAIELAEELSRPVRFNGLCLEAAAMLRQQAEQIEALKADAERYRKLVAMVDGYIGPSYSTYNDSICDGECCDYSQDKTSLMLFRFI